MENSASDEYPLYQLFLEYSKNQPASERYMNFKRMKDLFDSDVGIVKNTSTTVTLPRSNPPIRKHFYEVTWSKIQDNFFNHMHFFLCCSLYFDFMPKDGDHPYPLKVNMRLFGHDAAFYIFSRAQIWNNSKRPMERLLYITTDDKDFLGSVQNQNRNENKDTYNFEAYKDISFILNGDSKQDYTTLNPAHKDGEESSKETQKVIADHLLSTLNGKGYEVHRSHKMCIIRTMWMAVVLPFVAEPAPPSDETLRDISSVYQEMVQGARYDTSMEECIKGLGGGNPGCHELCYNLYERIASGKNSFKKVLDHPHAQNAKPQFTPSMVKVGSHEYRKTMFNDRDGAICHIAVGKRVGFLVLFTIETGGYQFLSTCWIYH